MKRYDNMDAFKKGIIAESCQGKGFFQKSMDEYRIAVL